jgi:4-amino-4-deoxy-L-arabinose transferase-like glycosyltransferase
MNILTNFLKKEKAPIYTLVIILLLFLSFTLYLALNMRMGVSPDSYYHLEVSQAYSQTLGIPENTPETYQWKDITRIPYLSLWINGRILNVNERTFDIDPVMILRISNILTSLGTLYILYLISKQLIKNKWGQILPVFLMSNTLMFVFLSSSINYDNLTVLFCTIAIYYLVKYIQEPKTLSNSILIFIFLLLGALTKNSIFPLGLIVTIIWVVVLFRRKVIGEETVKQILSFKNILLSLAFFVLLILFFNLYGVNYLTYGKLGPSCTDVLTFEQCLENGVFARGIYEIPKVFEGNMVEAFQLILSGERIGPIRYFPYWAVEMSRKIFGIMGDRSLFMRYEYIVPYFGFFFLGIYLLFKNRKKLKTEEKALLSIFVFYTLVVAYYVNYKAYISHDWKDLALQGRYIFPVLGIMYVLFSKYFLQLKNKKLLSILLILLVLLFILGNIAYFFGYVSTDWFISE